MTTVHSITHGNGEATRFRSWTLPALEEYLTRLVASWVEKGGEAEVSGTFSQREIRLSTAPATVADFCHQLQETLPLYLLTMVAVDDRSRTGNYLLRYVFGLETSDQFISVEITIPEGQRDQLTYQSITPRFPAANWYEREARDMFGLIPFAHPDPRRLLLHRHWPDGVRAMRRDFDISYQPPFTPDDEDYSNRTTGEGILEIPVGPIHAGIIEPGHFRFSAVGERIVNLEARLFYTHRGVEKLCEGLNIEQAISIVERNCAVCSVSSTMAYCQALENLLEDKQGIPARAAYLRLIYAELERLYNHIGDIGNICAGIGFHAGAQGGALLKEALLSMNERLLGSRYLFGLLKPGGVKRDLNENAIFTLEHNLGYIQGEFNKLLKLITNNEWVMDRFSNTGVLKNSIAHDLGAVGVAARASGIHRDVRRDYPYAAYKELQPESIPVLEAGDAHARFTIRAKEVQTSFKLISTALSTLPAGPLSVPTGDLPAYESSFSITESARGANCHWIMTGPDNTIYRYRIRTASYVNWPVVPSATVNNIVPDFPLINKSFELCYSCLDR